MADSDDVQIVFEQFQQPGLKNGTYTVTAWATIQDPGALPFRKVTKVLEVGSDAESIPAGSIDSVFPPENATGEFHSCLPHVVLNRPTLPWQKELMDKAADAVPWLAVLVVSDDELRSNGAATVAAGPATKLRMPLAFFRQIAPTAQDLAYLAHVRKVETTRKVDDTTSEIDYAIVVGNRLPTAGVTSNAYLVSLAGHGDLLPGGSAATDPVEITVLYAWRFFAIDEKRTFADVVMALDCDPAMLALPHDQGSADPAERLLAQGYVPMPHALRVGGQTVSLYRGPLVPYATQRHIAQLPIPSADAAIFYDPGTGIMDVSCAAAWTLGRQMALNAPSYATALYNWKRAAQRATIDRVVLEWDTGQTPPPGVSLGTARRRHAEQQLAAFLPHALVPLGGISPTAAAAVAPLAAAPPRAPRPTRAERARRLREVMTSPDTIAQLHQVHTDPLEIARAHVAAERALTAPGVDPPPGQDTRLTQIWSWLGDLDLLKRVPFFHLVPDARMLPNEAIRFFQIDQSWMEALIDGALSIGRVTEADASHDKAFRPMLREGGRRAAATARERMRGVPAADDAEPQLPPRPLSGFIMRSSAVTTWPGMEVEASDFAGAAATILRMDRSGTILICLFDRAVAKVVLHQPGEGIHFGFDVDDVARPTPESPPVLSKKRRRLDPDGGNPAGSEIADGNPLTAVPYRGSPALGVLDVRALAQWFADAFGMTMDQFTADDFAVEMVVGIEMVTFPLHA